MGILTDRELIIKIRNGEIEYFSKIVEQYLKPITGFVTIRIFDRDEVSDIVQNTFISFYKALNRFDEKKAILPYLYQIAKNEIKMYLRSRKTMFRLDDEMAVNYEGDNFYELEDYEKIINSLSKNQKEVLELLIEGYSYQEIANRLAKPLNTIKTLIRRARLAVLKNKDEVLGK